MPQRDYISAAQSSVYVSECCVAVCVCVWPHLAVGTWRTGEWSCGGVFRPEIRTTFMRARNPQITDCDCALYKYQARARELALAQRFRRQQNIYIIHVCGISGCYWVCATEKFCPNARTHWLNPAIIVARAHVFYPAQNIQRQNIYQIFSRQAGDNNAGLERVICCSDIAFISCGCKTPLMFGNTEAFYKKWRR